jgi:2-phosphosulfolactate phosphatase
VLTLIASADYPEDHACASYMEAIAKGMAVDLDALLEPLWQSERYRRLKSGEWPGFPPSDLGLALQADVFDFAMPATKADGYLRLTASF